MSHHQIRDAEIEDTFAVLRLNDAEVQWTSPIDPARLVYLAGYASYYRVIEVDGKVAGFLLAMCDGCGYQNANLEWFEARYSNFLYLDRIVIATKCAGQKLGSALYRDIFSSAVTKGFGRVTCEYSWIPRNLASEIFHSRHGFQEVGQRLIAGTNKVLSMQCRVLAAENGL